MPRLPTPRRGDILRIQGRLIPFTFWPTRETGGRRGEQTQIFTNDPWGVIFSSINEMPHSDAKSSALSFLEQARDYFRSADSSSLTAAKPVLVYYSILNLTKALLLKRGIRASLDVVFHGLHENNAGSTDPNQHILTAHPSDGGRVNLFDELLTLFRGIGLSNNTDIIIADLMPQTIIGHRMWCDASRQKEKFLTLARLEYCDCKDTKEIYLRLFFYRDDLRRLGITHSSLLVDTRLNQHFRVVQNLYSEKTRPTICLESIATSNYHGWPSDELLELSHTIKNRLWMILLDTPPYRRYYAYLCPSNSCCYLTQLPTIYALAFYFGSITRYRPLQFRNKSGNREIILDADENGFSISDNGPKIPKKDREIIFELGYTTKPNGKGMGLYISREVLSKIDYRIFVTEPRDGDGVTIRIEPMMVESEE